MLRPRTLRSRLFTALISAIAILVAIVTVVWRLTVEPALRLGVVIHHQEIARRAADQIDEFIENRVSELTAAVELGRFWREQTQSQREILYRLLKLAPTVQDVRLADREGRVSVRLARHRVYTDADLTPIDGEPGFRDALEGHVFISDVYHAVTAEPMVRVAVPVKFTATDIRGVLLAEINLKTLWNPISPNKVGQSGSAFVVDQAGRLIAHPDYSQVLLGISLANHPAVRLAGTRAREDGHLEGSHRPSDHKEIISAFAVVPRTRWVVIVEEPEATALAGVNRVKRLAIALTVVALAGSFGLSYWFTGRIARPIRQLQEGAARISRGDLGHRLDISTGDEIEALAHEFNDMARQLRDTRRRRTEVLAEIARDLSRSLDPEEVGRRILNGVGTLLGTKLAALYQVEPDSQDLVLLAGAGAGVNWNRVLVRGTGAVGVAMRERQPIVTPNVLQDDRITFTAEARARIERSNYRAVLAVPLMVKDRVIGALGVGDLCGRQFDQEEVQLSQTFADQAALALENARLFRQTAEHSRKLATLSALTRLITAASDPQEVFHEIGKAATVLLGAKLARVWAVDPMTGELRLQAAFGLDPQFERKATDFNTIPSGAGVAGRVLESRVAEYLEDAQTDSRWLNKRLVEEAGLHAYAGIPLITGDRALGVVSLLFESRRQFTPEEKELMSLLAAHAAIAIETSRLLDRLRAHQGRLETLVEVSRQLLRIQPVESLLQRFAEACGQLLQADSVAFRLVEGEDLVLSGTWGDTKAVILRERLRIGKSLAGQVAATGEPLVVMDPANDPRLTPEHRDGYRRLGIRAFLGVPVKVADRVEGVLTIRTCRPEGFSAEDQTIATAFALYAATALGNARLYPQVAQAYEELARTQDQLTQAQKMEAVGRLAGGVAHDFNNLLTIVTGRTQLMAGRLPPDDPLQRDIGLINKTAQRAVALISQLLAFSRKQVLQPRVLDLNAIVANLEPMLRRLIGEHIDLRTVPAPDLGRVKADPGQLEQVILNLAVNARDAMPQGGTLTIQTTNVEVDAAYARRHPTAQVGPHVMLAVSDTGCGMDPETKAHIFEPFFTTKEKGRGTGLGLATLYGVVTQSGGHIWVDSEPGQGATCKIYLARVEEVAETAERDAQPHALRPGSETVLLVEDEAELRELACEVLKGNGYTLLSAGDGIEALQIAEGHPGPIHLLLTDVIMPRMSGQELAGRVALTRPETRVLFMSGYTDDAIVHHGVLDPAVFLLEKAFTPDALLRKVREVLDAHEECPASAVCPDSRG